MVPLVILGVIIAVPTLTVLLLRANGGIIFLSVCLGSILATYVAGDTTSVVTAAGKGSGLAALQWVELSLLFLPVVLAIVLTRKKAKGLTLIMSASAAVAAGGLLALLAVPYMSPDVQSSIKATAVWHQLDNLQTLLIIVGSVLTFLQLFLARTKPAEKGKKHKR